MITAVCQSCDDVHPLGDRPTKRGTTACPSCGALLYRSQSDTTVSKSERERIVDAVEAVDGVGEETLSNIVDEFDLYAELTEASIDELTEIDLVGPETAHEIYTRT